MPNHTNKKPLLKFYSEKHDIHLLRHETHYDVEVLNHYSETSEVQNRLFNDKDKVVSIIIPTGKQPSESEFWANLGFKVNDGGVYLKGLYLLGTLKYNSQNLRPLWSSKNWI